MVGPCVHLLQAGRVCVSVAATLLVRVPVIISLRLMLWSVAGVVALPWFAYNATAGVSLLPQTWPYSTNTAHSYLACRSTPWQNEIASAADNTALRSTLCHICSFTTVGLQTYMLLCGSVRCAVQPSLYMCPVMLPLQAYRRFLDRYSQVRRMATGAWCMACDCVRLAVLLVLPVVWCWAAGCFSVYVMVQVLRGVPPSLQEASAVGDKLVSTGDREAWVQRELAARRRILIPGCSSSTQHTLLSSQCCTICWLSCHNSLKNLRLGFDREWIHLPHTPTKPVPLRYMQSS